MEKEENVTNLYPVRKTINFEFKPSVYTKKRVLDEAICEKSKLVDVMNNRIETLNLFNNGNQEIVKQTRKYFIENLKNFDEIFNKFKEITNKIKLKNDYENFKIYVDTDKIKFLGKDFRDCYQAMKRAKTNKGRGWDYYFCFNSETQKPEFRNVRLGDFLTIYHLFAFHYDKETKTGKFEKLFFEKTELLIKKYEFIKIELNDFLDENNQADKFITKPEILDRLKRIAFCLQEIVAVINIFCDEGKNGSDGSPFFINDLKNFRKSVLVKNCEEIIDEIIRQTNHITNPKAFHYKFTLNFKAKNPNTQLSGNDTFLSEKELQEKLKDEMDKLEKNKKEKSDYQSYISKFDNLMGKDPTEKKWNLIQNKQGLPNNFTEAKTQYDDAKKEKGELSKKISSNQDEKNNYAIINQIKAALKNSRNTHFGVLLKKDEKYFLALENKILGGKLKADNEYFLKKLENKSTSCQLLGYESLTWKAVEKLCLLPTSSLDGKDENVVEYWSKFCKSEIILEKKNEKDTRKLLDAGKIKTYLKKIVQNNKLFDEKTFNECKNLDEIKKYFDDFCFTNEWVNADWEEFLRLDKDGKIDLYQIFNKDFELDEKFATSENDQQIIERIKKAKENLGDKFVPKCKNIERSKNLFTIYWQNCFDNFNFDKYRLQPEGRVYVRDESPVQKSKRYQEKKVLGDFSIFFNPTTKEVNQTSKDGKTRIENFNGYINKHHQNEICIIGLDRGENSLVSYGLVKFKKKAIESSDIKVCFGNKIADEGWVLNEIIEAKDLSAVKVFNQNGGWKKNEFVDQKEDFYFTEKKGEVYDEEKNKKLAEDKKIELKKQYPDCKNGEERVFVLPIRHKPKNEFQKIEMKKSGTYVVKILSWEEQDGSVYNYRVAQEILKEKRLGQIEKNQDMELFETEKFKNGYVSALVGFIVEKVKEYNAFVSLENLNESGGKQGNYEKTFGASVYQIIENRLMSKLGYLVLKNNPQDYTQLAPKIRRIEELKKNIASNEGSNKNYQLGFVQITDETNTSKICPNCGYSKNRLESANTANGMLKLSLKTISLKNDDFGIDDSKKKNFLVDNKTTAYKYAQDGIICEEIKSGNSDFAKTFCDPRQNMTKSKDFIRCAHCGFDSRFPHNNCKKLEKITGGDTLATYNIAKRGLEFSQEIKKT